jgi:predicted permease
MGFIDKLRNSLLQGEEARRRAEDEARFHLEMRQADLEDRGLSAEEAAYKARRDFGNVLAHQENTGDRDVFTGLEAFSRDLKIAWRRLRRSPVFLVTSVFLLAFGIGVNTAVFSVIDHIFIRPLPLGDPDRLIVLEESRKGEKYNSNPVRMADWAARVPGFDSVMGTYGEVLPLVTNEGKRGIQTIRTAGDYLRVLGVAPLEGRSFSAEEQKGGLVAYLPNRSRHLGRLGDNLNIAGELYSIVAIVPDTVTLGEAVDVITPVPRAVANTSRAAGFLPVIARLKPSVTLAVATQQANAAAKQLAAEYPATDAGLAARLVPAQQAWNADAKESAWLLEAACLLLLAITILNLSALLAARTADRRKESAIRGFLGASRGAILRLHFVEALLLAGLGAAASLLVSFWSLEFLKHLFAQSFPALALVEIDTRVFAFLGLVAILASLCFALVMASQSAQTLRTQSRSKPWLRAGLIVGEAALGVLLLAAAFGLAAEFAERRARPLGFTTQSIVAASVDLPWSADHDELVAAMDRGHERFGAIPGVSSVGVVDRLPLNGGTQSGKVLIQGAPEPSQQEVGFRMASASFFSTLRIPILAGVPLGEKDAVLVNDVFARRFLNNNAVGRFIGRPGKQIHWWRVAGVVASVRADAKEAEARPEVWLPYRQFSWPKLEFVIATSQSATDIAPSLRKLTSQLSPNALLDKSRPSKRASPNSMPNPNRNATSFLYSRSLPSPSSPPGSTA